MPSCASSSRTRTTPASSRSGERRFPRRSTRRTLHRADLQYLRDAFAIPAIHQVLALHAGRREVRMEQRGTFAALAAHAVVRDAVRSFAAQLRAELLRGRVAARIVLGFPAAADVMQHSVHA